VGQSAATRVTASGSATIRSTIPSSAELRLAVDMGASMAAYLVMKQ